MPASTPVRKTQWCAQRVSMPRIVVQTLQPDWLIDREKLAGRFPPRVRARELWRVDPAWLEQARLAVNDLHSRSEPVYWTDFTLTTAAAWRS